MTLGPDYFDSLYERSDDPWQYVARWYELRKRALILAALPSRRYQRAFEGGVSTGELSAALAPRCDGLLASDAAHRAVQLAAARLAVFPHVRVDRRRLPEQWPDETFDLILISEYGYFLGATALQELFRRARRSLEPSGSLVICHWRNPIEGCELTGDAVHGMFGRFAPDAGLDRLVDHVERDFRLEIWSDDPMSVGEREGLA